MKADLTHYYGRTVMRVLRHKENSWQWMIELDGGVLIKNQDESLSTEPPHEIEGTTFLTYADDQMQFGSANSDGTSVAGSVPITADKFSVATPEGEDFPDYDPVFEALPPDPSPDRVASGPEKPQAKKKATKKASK